MSNGWHSEVLTTDDRERWQALVEVMPQRDVFFRPEYIIPFERLLGETAQLFFFGNEEDYIIYPFFLKPINTLPFYRAWPQKDETVYFDSVSPYGYSGPVACVRHPDCQRALWQDYLSAFHHYCVEMNIVSEFARLNPFIANHHYLQELTEGVQASNQITYLDLTQSEEALWQGLNRGNRSNINKAKRAGVKVDKGDQHGYLQRFYELYLVTMRRNSAAPWYDFSGNFFMESFKLLDDKILLLYASYEEQMIAAASFLHDGEVVHYFLGGSASEYLALRPNNLLMYEAICWAKHRGYRLFNLGGGYKEHLARFKATFSKLSTTFYTYRTIHQPALYDELERKYTSYRANLGQFSENSNHFPGYRADNSGQA